MFAISGVTGHVGPAAANELLAKGQKIRVIVRDAAKGERDRRGHCRALRPRGDAPGPSGQQRCPLGQGASSVEGCLADSRAAESEED
jgi:nucleoside-diphosphate-sugar epimerase